MPTLTRQSPSDSERRSNVAYPRGLAAVGLFFLVYGIVILDLQVAMVGFGMESPVCLECGFSAATKYIELLAWTGPRHSGDT